MIEISSKTKVDRYQLDLEGHSGYADLGEDIICAAISALTFTLISGIETVLGLGEGKFTYYIGEDAHIRAEVKRDKLNDDEDLGLMVLVKTFENGVIQSSVGYEDFVSIDIEEVQDA